MKCPYIILFDYVSIGTDFIIKARGINKSMGQNLSWKYVIVDEMFPLTWQKAKQILQPRRQDNINKNSSSLFSRVF